MPTEIVCWDVFKNASPESPGFWQSLASQLLGQLPTTTDMLAEGALQTLVEQLKSVASGAKHPAIEYCVIPMEALAVKPWTFDLIYSQAAIEHVWFIERFWLLMGKFTAPDGWHSHRIDLADHGRRRTNPIEMCQWSDWAYWSTQRFVPGAINRWRAVNHLQQLDRLGFSILYQHRDQFPTLPILRHQLSRSFRSLEEAELRTTGLDLVARRPTC